MKTNELKELGADELAAKIREARKELVDLRLRHASKVDVEKPVRMRLMRRGIARMMTIQAAAKNVSKLTGIEQIRNTLGLAEDEIAVFGDDLNDLPPA